MSGISFRYYIIILGSSKFLILDHKESDLETDQPQSLSQTASHSYNNKVYGEAKEIDGSVVSGLVNNEKDTETSNNKAVHGEEMGIVSAGFKGKKICIESCTFNLTCLVR